MIKQRHKHAELLRAIADGEQIQLLYESAYEDGYWDDASHGLVISQIVNGYCKKWRIKPQPEPDIINKIFVEAYPKLDNAWNTPNLELTFDGETQKLKAVRILDAA